MDPISHRDLAQFAKDRVNLPKAKADQHRAQARALRDRLTAKINSDPGFDLVKMRHSGSVAKGTALRTVNDLDMVVYVKASAAPKADHDLLPWLADRLAEANPSMRRDQFTVQDHCVTITYAGSCLNIDVVPAIYEGDPDDRAYLVRKHTGQRVLTSVTLHLAFIRSRKQAYGDDYAQMIRLTKWWKRTQQGKDSNFRFKSFLIELIWAHLADTGTPMNDYVEAMKSFFTFIVKTELRDRIYFTDNYGASDLPAADGTAAIDVIDPVNPDNNVGRNYASYDRDRIVAAARDALDAITDAEYATTRGEQLADWRDILGRGFGA